MFLFLLTFYPNLSQDKNSQFVINVLSIGYTETKIFLLLTLLYTLKRRKRKLFSPSKKNVFLSPLIKSVCIRKSPNIHLHQQKIF